MGALDFLFEGQQPPSTTRTNSQTTSLPQWLADYGQGVVQQAGAVANQPYQAYEGPRIAGFTPEQLQAFDATSANVGKAPAMIEQAAQQPGALTAAQPYLAGGNKTYTGDTVKDYMDPYVSNVIDYAGTLAQRQLNEKLLPSVAATFGAAGSGPRSTQMRTVVDRDVRDLTEGLNQQGLSALSSAYQSGATTFGNDANRQAQLAGITGQLASNERGQTATLADQLQRSNLTDAAALEAVGGEKQDLTQKSYNTAYQDFINQRDYPKTQTAWLDSILSGTPHDTNTAGVSTAPAGPNDMVAPPISQIGGALTGLSGLLKNIQPVASGATTGAARGGLMRKYNRGGGVTRYLHG